MRHMAMFSTGEELRRHRSARGLSQAKLADITGIIQARLSAYELGKNGMKSHEIAIIQKALNSLTDNDIQLIKVKRYREHIRTGETISSRQRRSYSRTPGNAEYLAVLNELEWNRSCGVRKRTDRPKALSMFAGCGGLCYGVESAGFQIVGFSEIHKGFRNIYQQNFPNVHQMTPDMRDINTAECTSLSNREGDIALMAGGPPCQGFSLAGKRDPADARNALFYDYLRVAEVIRPKAVLMENVRVLTSMRDPDGRLVTDCIMNDFSAIGYQAAFFCLNAKDYGVPQHRERVIFVAIREDVNRPPAIPAPTHGPSIDLFGGMKPFRTFGDAVSDLEYLESGEKSQKDKWHAAVSHPEHVIKWLIDVPQGCSAHDNKDTSMRPPSGYNTTYKRQVWNEPGATVGTTFAMISGCRNVHPIATRSLTTREAMRLQSFPDSFRLKGNIGDMRTAIGNAVPPLLAYEISSFILQRYIL